MEMERARVPPSFIRDLLPAVLSAVLPNAVQPYDHIRSNSKGRKLSLLLRDHCRRASRRLAFASHSRFDNLRSSDDRSTFERALLSARRDRARHSSSSLSASNIPGPRCHGSEIGLVTSGIVRA